MVRESWLAVAGDAITALEEATAGQPSQSKENRCCNTASSTSATRKTAGRLAGSIELLARLIHVAEQEGCQDPLFRDFEHDLSQLFLQPGTLPTTCMRVCRAGRHARTDRPGPACLQSHVSQCCERRNVAGKLRVRPGVRASLAVAIKKPRDDGSVPGERLPGGSAEHLSLLIHLRLC